MENKKKKLLLMIIMISSLSFAAITIFNASISQNSADDIIKSYQGQPVWLKCLSCGKEYEIDKKQYLEFVKNNSSGVSAPNMECTGCGKKKAVRIEKCQSCGFVFMPGSVSNDYSDRCPKCNFSSKENLRK